jgi:hypothetical protein
MDERLAVCECFADRHTFFARARRTNSPPRAEQQGNHKHSDCEQPSFHNNFLSMLSFFSATRTPRH